MSLDVKRNRELAINKLNPPVSNNYRTRSLILLTVRDTAMVFKVLYDSFRHSFVRRCEYCANYAIGRNTSHVGVFFFSYTIVQIRYNKIDKCQAMKCKVV